LRLRHSTTSSCEGESATERFTSAFSGITPQSIRKRFSFNNRCKPNKVPSVTNQDASAETIAATHQELKKKISNNQPEKENKFESSAAPAPVTVFVVTPDGDPGTIAFTPRADTRCLSEITQLDSVSVKSGAHFFSLAFFLFHPVELTTCDKSHFYCSEDVF